MILLQENPSALIVLRHHSFGSVITLSAGRAASAFAHEVNPASAYDWSWTLVVNGELVMSCPLSHMGVAFGAGIEHWFRGLSVQ